MFLSNGRLGLIAGLIYTLLLLAAAAGDIRARRIPNRLVLVLLLSGLGFSVSIAPVIPGAIQGFGGMLTGFACWLPFYAMGWLGAGDVKLFAAAGSWLGPLHALEGSLIAAVSGALLALAWMVWTKGAGNVATTLAIAAARPATLAPGAHTSAVVSNKVLPYGVALAIGALAAAWMPGLLL